MYIYLHFQVAGTTWPRHEYSILVTGVARFKIITILQNDPYAVAQIEAISRVSSDDRQDINDVKDMIENFRAKAINLLEMLDLSLPAVAKLRVNVFKN